MLIDYSSLAFQEKIKHTINDFILHFVQFTKHLFQDFLMKHKQTDNISVHNTSNISLFTGEILTHRKQMFRAKSRISVFIPKTNDYWTRKTKHKEDLKNTQVSSNFWLVVSVMFKFWLWVSVQLFRVFSLPVSFYQGLTSLCHCHPPQAVSCIIKNHSLLDSLLLFCFTDISNERCCFQLSPWSHWPVCRVSSVPRLLCTI